MNWRVGDRCIVYRAWNCYDGGVLWQSASGLIYC
jgi:hypothetical protein